MMQDGRAVKQILSHGLDVALGDAFHWLEDEQPEGASLSHHGIYWKAEKPPFLRIVRVIPNVRGIAIVVFDKPYENGDQMVFNQEELDALKTVVSEKAQIGRSWNGTNKAGYFVDSVSFAIQHEVHMSLIIATSYRCPEGCTFKHCDVCNEARRLTIKPDGWA